MRHLRLVIACIAAAACVPPPSTDPHAVGVNQQQWVATVPGAPSAAFDVAMRVLTDSAYPIADARKDAGLIKTRGRKASHVQRGMAQLKSMMGSDYPITLSVLISPAGTDSSRIAITGEYTLENISQSANITARDKQWPFVSGIGTAIVQTIRP